MPVQAIMAVHEPKSASDELYIDSGLRQRLFDDNWWDWGEFEGGWWDFRDKGYRTGADPWDSPEMMRAVLKNHGWKRPGVAGYYRPKVDWISPQEVIDYLLAMRNYADESFLEPGQKVTAQLIGRDRPASEVLVFTMR